MAWEVLRLRSCLAPLRMTAEKKRTNAPERNEPGSGRKISIPYTRFQNHGVGIGDAVATALCRRVWLRRTDTAAQRRPYKRDTATQRRPYIQKSQ